MGYDALRRVRVDDEVFHGWPHPAWLILYDLQGEMLKKVGLHSSLNIPERVYNLRLGLFPWCISIGVLYEIQTLDPRAHDYHYVEMVCSNISYVFDLAGYKIGMKRNVSLGADRKELAVWDVCINISNSR